MGAFSLPSLRLFCPMVETRYVTGGYVSMPESGERLAQVIAAPECAKSNVYWSWNGGAKTVGIEAYLTSAASFTTEEHWQLFVDLVVMLKILVHLPTSVRLNYFIFLFRFYTLTLQLSPSVGFVARTLGR